MPGAHTRYPVVLPRTIDRRAAQPLSLRRSCSAAWRPDDVVVCANAHARRCVSQVAQYPERASASSATPAAASMGYDLPAAIGAAVARGGKRVICLAGDGSLQMNIQELQTIAHHRWPIKLFVLNNGGYLSIRQTQASFFGQFVGESEKSGVSFPAFDNVGNAYGIPAFRIESHNFAEEVDRVLNSPGPCSPM